MIREINFEPLKEKDLPMLLEWLLREHVKEWWDEGEDTIEKVRTAYAPEVGVSRYVMFVKYSPNEGRRAAGYFQHYKAGNDVVGIDLFIGEPDLINIGLGTEALKRFVLLISERESPAKIVLDPDPENLRAIRCYEKAGFRHYETVRSSDGKESYMMECFCITG